MRYEDSQMVGVGLVVAVLMDLKNKVEAANTMAAVGPLLGAKPADEGQSEDCK
jgi:hypothetical protein